MHDPRHVTRRHARTAQDLADRVDHSEAGVVGRGRNLLDVKPAIGVGEDDIGERAADVDTDEPARVAHSPDSSNW